MTPGREGIAGAHALYPNAPSTGSESACWRSKRRNGKKGKLQIAYGLRCAPDGCPVAIEVLERNTADPRTSHSLVG
jgi:hypothetical protein